MIHSQDLPAIAFCGSNSIASGALAQVALAAKAAIEAGETGPVLVFDAGTGHIIDLDFRGTAQDVVGRLGPTTIASTIRLPGRPKLGVVAREVTLLPRHWEWLAQQKGGASVALRQLVEAARRQPGGKGEIRAAQETAYRFMAAMAGNYPGYEEAIRALFASDAPNFDAQTRAWPEDVRAHAAALAQRAFTLRV